MTDFKRIYLDTAIVVYFLDLESVLHEKTKQVFNNIFQGYNEIIVLNPVDFVQIYGGMKNDY